MKSTDQFEFCSYTCVDVSGNKIGKVEVVAENVKASESIFGICCGKLYYGESNNDDLTNSFYIDGEKIAHNAGYWEQFTLNAMYIYNSSEDIEGDEKHLLYTDGNIVEIKDIDKYDGYAFTKKENLVCYSTYGDTLAVADKNGKITVVEGEFSNVVYPPETYIFS